MTKQYFRIHDEEVRAASDATDLVTQLRDSSRVPVASNTAFRIRAAYWAGSLGGAPIRTENDEVFLEDMLTAGLYERVEGPAGDQR